MNKHLLRTVVLVAIPAVSLSGAAFASQKIGALLMVSGGDVPTNARIRDCALHEDIYAFSRPVEINGDPIVSNCNTNGLTVGTTGWTGSDFTCGGLDRHRAYIFWSRQGGATHKEQCNNATSNQFGTGFPSSVCWNTSGNLPAPNCSSQCSSNMDIQFSTNNGATWSGCRTGRTVTAMSLGQGHP